MTWGHRKVLAAILDRVAEQGDQSEATFLFEEVENWPNGVLQALMAAKLICQAPPVDVITCLGCEERCRRPITMVTSADQDHHRAMTSCHQFADRGPFSHDLKHLMRWTSRRELVARFVRRSSNLQINDRDDRWRRIRFNTLSIEGVQRPFSLEFNGTPTAIIGSSSLSLLELLEWRDGGIRIDLEALGFAAVRSEDLQSGNKRTQPSTATRDDNKKMNERRNRRVQKSLDALAPFHPKLNKDALAKLLQKSGGGEGMTASRIARVTRMPKKK